ncbi:hypothetical protein SAMN05421504_104423 [Amycolatopsis xylanica]|uniref:Uncharacterized protein n=1 Tax=Amycolatopsis xylanica TaxID=589385 RepID=A0A1H3GYE0_9PSEU|nr:hypothetical protein [Amycolatopsis xylanica]SDY07544.1 hypothetical protein SAMN05421504_104423 [Amycolatopsis xylanica]
MLQDLDGLVARRHGPHVVVSRHDEPTPPLPVAGMPGRLFVLVTAAARELLGDTLPASLLPAGPVTEIWLGADEKLARGLREELGVPVFTPRGGFIAEPGAAMFAEGGWRHGETVHFRFPVPAWESVLRGEQVTGAGVVAWQIPAGLVVRTVSSPVADALSVPVDFRFPKIVVGAGVSPDEVAELLGRLPLGPFLVVPGVTEVSTQDWQRALAGLLERDIVFSTMSTYRPFATVLRQPVAGGAQEVLDIAAAPPGWARSGERQYQRGPVRASVLPGGLLLSMGGAVAGAEAFDPAGWTLTVGSAGELVGLPLLEAAERLLDGLDPARRAVVRVRLGGDVDERGREALARCGVRSVPAPLLGGRECSGRLEPVKTFTTPVAEAAPVAEPEPVVEAEPVAEPALPAPEVAAPVVEAEPVLGGRECSDRLEPAGTLTTPVAEVAAPEPVLPDLSFAPPPIMTMSSAPVSTVSGPPEPVEPELPEPELPVAEELEPLEPEPEPEPIPEPVPEPEIPVVEELPVVEHGPLVIADRPSTSAEQTRFTAAAGEVFGEALATVNAALATWPSMRYGGEAELKADYVAVCLYLGRGEAGTAELNQAVRGGQAGGVDALVPCLVSGIRRLPTHRRAVLRQGKLGEAIERRSTPGTVLTEPGFLTASIDLAVTVPDADFDVLIWPCSARRTSDLLMNRPVDEAIFVAGARFKALAIRTADDEDPPEEDVPTAPKVAVLFRELAPGETPTGDELDDRDLAVLAKLDRVLARRRGGELRLVDDPDLITRLSTSMLEWHESATVTAAAS